MNKDFNLENRKQQDIARENAKQLALEFGLYNSKSVNYLKPLNLNDIQNIIQLKNSNLKASLFRSNLS